MNTNGTFDENPHELKRSPIDTIIEWAQTLVMAIFLVVFCFTFLFRIAKVEGHSMENTLFENDRLIISHLFYTPENGDIVVIESQALSELIIKRVIAVEGQRVEIDYNEGTVSVDGEIIDEPYIKSSKMYSLDGFANEYYNEDNDTYQYDVPDGCVFVMGDNRNNSADSRIFGCVENEDIIGRVIVRIYSQRAKIGSVG